MFDRTKHNSKTNLLSAMGLVPLLAACTPDANDQTLRGADVLEPHMGDEVFHVGIHVFTAEDSPEQVTQKARTIKQMVLNSPNASTCFEGPAGRAQLAIQTEFTALEYAEDPVASVEALDQRLDALFAEGIAVHLLLPFHYITPHVLNKQWPQVDWAAASQWSNKSYFAPMKPCADEWTDGVQCPYDVIFQGFQQPVIAHLVETGRADKLAVIYVGNEFGYDPNTDPEDIPGSEAEWGGGANWKVARAEALSWTARRALDTARDAADGHVRVGLKFVDVQSPHTGWTPYTPGSDQLSHIVHDVMGPGGDVFGYDAYISDTGYDSKNYTRLKEYFDYFPDGRFEIAEFGRQCVGAPGSLSVHERTSVADVTGTVAKWWPTRGINMFGFNVTGIEDGCYSLVEIREHPGNGHAHGHGNGNGNSHGPDIIKTLPGANNQARGLWEQFQAATGTSDPWPCADGQVDDPVIEPEPCTPTVDSVSPLTASLNQNQVFTVHGSCLPNTLAAWIADCDELMILDTDTDIAQFSCTPKWTSGTKSGLVKDEPGGTVLAAFELDVQ
ncbi:hypothetical protein ENSA5_06330 [Enhygromyxa salina]|uniref:Uncharacterized protein n=1 Tax=Enhygromyxa salina TaxID=215803 RepID=A0A2S9YHP5_9BACT|nr:hypothetical protein [Enhygromyxa salina]PRQ04628.1 hypothetical protein ENSA5_06330 [Enhygromyxa salina]